VTNADILYDRADALDALAAMTLRRITNMQAEKARIQTAQASMPKATKTLLSNLNVAYSSRIAAMTAEVTILIATRDELRAVAARLERQPSPQTLMFGWGF
jgi:hypothetical protein